MVRVNAKWTPVRRQQCVVVVQSKQCTALNHPFKWWAWSWSIIVSGLAACEDDEDDSQEEAEGFNVLIIDNTSAVSFLSDSAALWRQTKPRLLKPGLKHLSYWHLLELIDSTSGGATVVDLPSVSGRVDDWAAYLTRIWLDSHHNNKAAPRQITDNHSLR